MEISAMVSEKALPVYLNSLGSLAEMTAIHKTRPAMRFILITHWEGPASAEEPQLADVHPCQSAFSKRQPFHRPAGGV